MRYAKLYLVMSLALLAATELPAAEQNPSRVIVPRSANASSSSDPTAIVAERKLLAEKVAARDQLQREIEALQGTLDMSEQFLLFAQLLEVNHTKCRAAGFDFQWPAELESSEQESAEQTAAGTGARVLPMEASKEFLATLKNLERKNCVRTIASPTLVSVSGRPAEFRAGGEIFLPTAAGKPGGAELKSFGTSARMTVHSLGNSKAKIEVKLVECNVNEARSVRVAGEKYPAFDTIEAQTTCELTCGETCVLGGMRQKREADASDEEIELLLVLKVEATEGLAPRE